MRFKTLSRALIVMTAVVMFAVAPAADARTGASAGSAARGAHPASCTPGHKACPIRINFASGAYSAQASSSLQTVFQKRWFVVSLNKGQQVTLWVIGAGATRGFVYFGHTAIAGVPGGRIWDDTAHATGDYTVKAVESPMGEQWSGRVTVLVVAI